MTTIAEPTDRAQVRQEAAEYFARHHPPPLDPVLRPTAEGRYRRAWARQYTENVTGIPAYGSTEWAQLHPGDPRKLAAAIQAAEAWAMEGEDLEVEHAQRLYDLQRAREQTQAEADHAARQVAAEAVRALNRVEYRQRSAEELRARAAAGHDRPGIEARQ